MLISFHRALTSIDFFILPEQKQKWAKKYGVFNKLDLAGNWLAEGQVQFVSGICWKMAIHIVMVSTNWERVQLERDDILA